MKTIWNVGGWKNFNYGDCILQSASSRIIRDALGEEIRFVYIDTQRTWFSPQLIDKLNREADMLLLGGGGFIMYRPQDKSKSEWQFNIRTEDIKRIKVPLVACGMGCNKFPHDSHNFSSNMWENIQNTIDRSALFSVRNAGTLKVLKDNGISTDKISVIPDAGMFVEPEVFNHPIFDNKCLKVGLNWATDRAVQRFGSEQAARDKLEVVLAACKDLTIKYNAQIYIIEHLIPNELNAETKTLLKRRAKEVLGNRLHILYEQCEELYPPHEYYAGFFADIYRKMDLILGMRGHANIISFGVNTPMIGIGQHRKVKWFLEEIDRSEYLVALNQSNQEDYSLLSHKIDQILSNDIKNHKILMYNKFHDLSKVKDQFVNKIVEILK